MHGPDSRLCCRTAVLKAAVCGMCDRDRTSNRLSVLPEHTRSERAVGRVWVGCGWWARFEVEIRCHPLTLA